MNFSDEEYVRLYVTDTVTWRVLPWEARVTMVLALRKFDKAGVFEFGKHGAEKSLAAAIDLPLEIVSKGLSALLAEEVWTLEPVRLLWPRYIEAQNCKRSDRLRQRMSRANRNRDAVNDSGYNRDRASHSATGCHDSSQVSQIVTPGRGRGSGEAREGKGEGFGSDARRPAAGAPEPSKSKTREDAPGTVSVSAPPQASPPIPETSSRTVSVPRRGPLTIPDAQAPRRPTEAQLEAVSKPLAERAREVQARQGDSLWLSMLNPQLWPELIEAAKLFHETWGLAAPILGNYTRDKGVQALVELYSAGVDQPTMLSAIRASRGDDWFQGQAAKHRPGLSMLTPEVVRRLVPKPKDAVWEAELEQLAKAAEASRKRLEEQRNAE